MQPLNNLDVVILIITAVSALIALWRGFVKEVLSIVGWILAAVLVFWLLPILTPYAQRFIQSAFMAGIVTSLLILIVFYVIWLLTTDKMIGKIRTSKLSALDRILGLLFGVVRAALIVILFNILIGWLLPEESKSGMFADSRYYQLAGRFAEPLENLIPEETIEQIRAKSAEVGLGDLKGMPAAKAEADTAADTQSEDSDVILEKLIKPQIEKIDIKSDKTKEDNFKGYPESETNSLDRLVETTAE